MHGELAAILGEAALPVDKLMRTLGIMDMARTSVNLLGNCLATAVMARSCSTT